MYYTYIIESELSGKLYIGQTNDLFSRLKRHNNNENKYTKNKGPWKLIFSKEFELRTDAMKFEKKLKSFKNSVYIKSKILSGEL